MAYEEDSCIRGYHLYQAIWTAVVGECLVCQRKPLNSSDRYAVAVLKDECCCRPPSKTPVEGFVIIFVEKWYY